MMKEAWDEYIDRVSRARHHVLLDKYQEFFYYHGAKVAAKLCENFGIYFYSKRQAIKAVTKALILQDRVLTYREDEAYE